MKTVLIMATLISSFNEYLVSKAMLLDRFSDIEFENNPFNERYKHFIAFEFDFIFKESFFCGLKSFLKSIENDSAMFYTIDPSPFEYFYKHYKKYSIFRISTIATDEELNEIMTQEPIENSGDSINTSSETISWFSMSKEWAILGSREWEIAVIGFTDLEIRQKFIGSFSKDAQTMFTNVKHQGLILDEMLGFDEKTKAAYQNLANNYKDKV